MFTFYSIYGSTKHCSVYPRTALAQVGLESAWVAAAVSNNVIILKIACCSCAATAAAEVYRFPLCTMEVHLENCFITGDTLQTSATRR